MADLSDVYGTHYQDESVAAKTNYIINTIANNVAHRQFNFKLTDSRELWDHNYNMLPTMIDKLVTKVKAINHQMCLLYIDKQSEKINMLKELVVNSPVEYFWIIDGEFNRAYFIYITPYEVTAY
jgi:hypothetical protein